jgi:uncharacterized cupredoxin-like copper-binding protein
MAGKVLVLVLVLPALIVMGIMVATAATSQKAVPTPTAVTSSQNRNTNTILYDHIEQTPVPGATRVAVSLVEYKISSSLLTFHAGSTYYFVVSNRGQEVHEFMMMPQNPDGSELSPADQYKDKLIELEQIAPGSTLTINFTFKPTSAGRYEIACQMRGHYIAGMKLPIRVTA